MTQKHDEIGGNGTARQARKRRLAARRGRSYRERMKSDRRPLGRDVDSALSEGLAFLIAKHGAAKPVDLRELAVVARICLEREGFAPGELASAIRGRLAKRDEHRDPGHLPTLAQTEVSRVRPTKHGNWESDVGEYIAFSTDGGST